MQEGLYLEWGLRFVLPPTRLRLFRACQAVWSLKTRVRALIEANWPQHDTPEYVKSKGCGCCCGCGLGCGGSCGLGECRGQCKGPTREEAVKPMTPRVCVAFITFHAEVRPRLGADAPCIYMLGSEMMLARPAGVQRRLSWLLPHHRFWSSEDHPGEACAGEASEQEVSDK